MEVRRHDRVIGITSETIHKWEGLGRSSTAILPPPYAPENNNTLHSIKLLRQFHPSFTLLFIILNTLIYFLIDSPFDNEQANLRKLIQFGAYSYPLIIQNNEYWRLITSAFLHIGFSHFVFNIGLILILGLLIERIYGSWQYLIIYLTSAAAGNLLSLFWIRDSVGAGASGAVFGVMGVMVAYGIWYKNKIPNYQKRIFGYRILPFIILDLIIGIWIPQINVAAHVGGFICGLIAAVFITPQIYRSKNSHRSFQTKAIGILVGSATTCCFAIAILHSFTDTPDMVDARVEIVMDTIKSPSSIIRQYEIRTKRRYNRRDFETLELLYLEQLQNDPESTTWINKLKSFYSRALESDPSNKNWNENMLALYFRNVQGTTDEATELADYIATCKGIARKHGYHEPLYRNLEIFLQHALTLPPYDDQPAKQNELEEFYYSAIEVDEANPTWKNNLAWYYVERKIKSAKAVTLAQNAVKLSPSNSTLLDTLAWAYMRNQNHIKSLHVFEAVFWNVSESNKSNISEDQAAEKSSWHGLTTLIDGFSSIPNSHDFDHAFSDFHRRLSTDLTQNADFQAKLTQAFNRFKTLRDN